MTTNLNTFYLNQLPIPCLTGHDPEFAPIVTRAAKLICTTPEFDDLAAEVGLGSHANGVTDPAERAQLRAELDGMVAHIYGLTEEEFRHILSTFPLVDDEVKEAALVEYQRYADDPAIVPLIQSGEGAAVEFKIGACRNPHTGNRDDKMRNNVVEAVAGFMNGSGGTLLIGVADDGTIAGVDLEYPIANSSKANWDGYELFLSDLLNNTLSIENPFQSYVISRHTVEGKDVARVQVTPASKPVYVNNKLYLRAGNRTKELQGPDLVDFVNSRAKSS